MRKLLIASLFGATMLVVCSNDNDKYVGTWNDANDSTPAFTITKTDKGLSLQTTGESSSIEVQASGNNLTVDGTTFTLDDKTNELSTDGMFDTKIVFKKAAGEQK